MIGKPGVDERLPAAEVSDAWALVLVAQRLTRFRGAPVKVIEGAGDIAYLDLQALSPASTALSRVVDMRRSEPR